MRFIFCICMIFFFTSVFGQKKPNINVKKSLYTKQLHRQNNLRLRSIQQTKSICPIFKESKYPYHGIGFKMGDPFAISYKFYATKNFSIVADFGKPAKGLYNTNFQQKFEEYQRPDTLSSGATIKYLTHKLTYDIVTDVRLLYSFDVKKIFPGVQIYFGSGFEFRRSNMHYDYIYDKRPTTTDPKEINLPGKVNFEIVTYGLQGTIGFEYSYFQLPISFFAEYEYYVDLKEFTNQQQQQGGVGLRYIFKRLNFKK